MRQAFGILVLLLVAGCGDEPADQRSGAASAEADRIACAVDGAPDFERVCTIERLVGPEGLVLTVRAPGGGFRRLLVTTDGRGVVAADGAERAQVSPAGDNLIDVRIGNDRYRLPATVKAAIS